MVSMAILHDVLGRYANVGPIRFLVTGVWLFALKFMIDRLVATIGFARPWSPLNYLMPNEAYGLPLLPAPDRIFYATMLAVALPFVWIGIVLTLRRLSDAGLPRWLAVLFFVPVANLLFFLALGVLPSKGTKRGVAIEPLPVDAEEQSSVPLRVIPLGYGHDDESRRPLVHWFPRSAAASAFVAVFLPVPLAVGLAFLAARVFRDYGWGIFVAMPFVVGMTAAVLHGYRTPRTIGQSLGVGCLSLAASGAGMITFAIEGLGCLIMCAPLGIPVAMLGAALGHSLLGRPDRDAGLARAVWSVLLCAPLLLGAESLVEKTPTYFPVQTSVDIDAPPMTVWRHVVTFSDIPKPDDWMDETTIPISTSGGTRHPRFGSGRA